MSAAVGKEGVQVVPEGSIGSSQVAENPDGVPVSRPDTSVLVAQRLAENADDLDALFVFAAMEAQEGRVAEGLVVLDHVLRLDPAYPGGWRFKAKLHGMIGEREAERGAQERAEGEED